MQKQDVDRSPKSRLNQRRPGKVGLVLLGVALLLSLALGSAVMTYPVMTPLVPKMPYTAAGVTAHLRWYLQGGQLKVNVRTLAAMFRYFVEPESDMATGTNYTNLPVAGNAASNSPQSSDSLPEGFNLTTTPG
jgi:hypothetical protein